MVYLCKSYSTILCVVSLNVPGHSAERGGRGGRREGAPRSPVGRRRLETTQAPVDARPAAAHRDTAGLPQTAREAVDYHEAVHTGGSTCYNSYWFRHKNRLCILALFII